FFRQPATSCTTWCYFTPATRKGGMLAPYQKEAPVPLIGGIEIYTSPTALSYVQNSAEYKGYFGQVKSEDLYEKDESLEAWYPAGGFVARPNEKETGKAGIVVLAKFVAKEGEANKEKLVQVLDTYCTWVRDNEPTTLTYGLFTRPKSPNEVLLFERYKDLPAIGAHGKTKEFKAMFKGTGPYVQGKKTVLSEWEELEGSFVGNVQGGA
ncbi:uncharacterized protein A1O9_03072, partial [Exophiala aquamarina CBS 119918]